MTGQKSDLQIQSDVKAQLTGLVGKVVDVGGSAKGTLTREEFEGLSRDATAAALEGDRGCRERVFSKMFDKLSAAEAKTPATRKSQPSVNKPPPTQSANVDKEGFLLTDGKRTCVTKEVVTYTPPGIAIPPQYQAAELCIRPGQSAGIHRTNGFLLMSCGWLRLPRADHAAEPMIQGYCVSAPSPRAWLYQSRITEHYGKFSEVFAKSPS